MKRVFVALLVLALTGCGDNATSGPETTAAQRDLPIGGELFEQRVIGANPGCVTCHSFDEGVVLVGPSLFDLAVRAPGQVEGLSAEDYLRQSIVDPDAFIVPGFSKGQMVGGFDESLTPEQVDSLISFLLGIGI